MAKFDVSGPISVFKVFQYLWISPCPHCKSSGCTREYFSYRLEFQDVSPISHFSLTAYWWREGQCGRKFNLINFNTEICLNLNIRMIFLFKSIPSSPILSCLIICTPIIRIIQIVLLDTRSVNVQLDQMDCLFLIQWTLSVYWFNTCKLGLQYYPAFLSPPCLSSFFFIHISLVSLVVNCLFISRLSL